MTSDLSGSRPQAEREPRHRLFFALWPDETMRDALAHSVRKAVRASGGRPVAADKLHVTLAFLGAVPESRLTALADAARAASRERPRVAPLLELPLERLEYWTGPSLLCVLPEQPPPGVTALAQRLLERLAAAGFAPDLKPFRPHVTVARKVTRATPSLAMRSAVWRLSGFALIESRTLESGSVYSVVQSFPLVGNDSTEK